MTADHALSQTCARHLNLLLRPCGKIISNFFVLNKKFNKTFRTTPASDLESRTLTEFIARMNFENAQRSPVTQAPPPTYEQAIRE
jgi:hypothetical protein